MKRIQIIKLGQVTNQTEMPEAEALAWLAKGQTEHWFGRPARYESQMFEIGRASCRERVSSPV